MPRRRYSGRTPVIRIRSTSSANDELAAGRAVVGPKARDLRATLVELGAELRPDRRADAAPAEPRIDGEADEVPPRVEAARLVMDLAVAERRVLLVGGDDTN